jgi:predicted TIM-barrel fold metal-dependent hydrolase
LFSYGSVKVLPLPNEAQMPRPGMATPAAVKLQNIASDLGEGRIAAMDAAGIDVQVLSLNAPGVEQLDATDAVKVARDSNDILADAVRRHPTRFAGFASLPTMSPETAVEELDRTVRKLSFKGAAINGHTRGRYLDDKFFWPILERAEALQVPLYLHPTPPPRPVIEASYTGNFSAQVTTLLSTGGWGWHIETAIHTLRLILSGAFDRYPRLQLIIGHLGEALPFMLRQNRSQSAHGSDETALARSAPICERTSTTQLVVSTSCLHSLTCSLRSCPPNHILQQTIPCDAIILREYK